jgi:hypothetical protein
MTIKQPKTVYGIYIIEFLRDKEFKDGENLDKILKLSKIPSEYKWANHKDHFQSLLKEFIKSNYRYLHLSCHGDRYGLEINDEVVTNFELQKYLKDGMLNKRIFMSACKGGNSDLAKRMICKCGALSLIGTPIDIDFHAVALFWPPFYYGMNLQDQRNMSRRDLKDNLKTCVDLFKVPINYYSKTSDPSSTIKRIGIRPNKPNMVTTIVTIG